MKETRRFPPPKNMRMPVDDHSPMPESRPLNDLGREMEVILYGQNGGFVEKLGAMRVFNRSATILQCMMRLRAFTRRVARRRRASELKAALTLQKRWRNRRAASLGGMADLFANLSLAAHKVRTARRSIKCPSDTVPPLCDRAFPCLDVSPPLLTCLPPLLVHRTTSSSSSRRRRLHDGRVRRRRRRRSASMCCIVDGGRCAQAARSSQGPTARTNCLYARFSLWRTLRVCVCV